jgi:hypothetical protein
MFITLATVALLPGCSCSTGQNAETNELLTSKTGPPELVKVVPFTITSGASMEPVAPVRVEGSTVTMVPVCVMGFPETVRRGALRTPVPLPLSVMGVMVFAVPALNVAKGVTSARARFTLLSVRSEPFARVLGVPPPPPPVVPPPPVLPPLVPPPLVPPDEPVPPSDPLDTEDVSVSEIGDWGAVGGGVTLVAVAEVVEVVEEVEVAG